jgi:NAD(P)-dependent dehydrogenase (short-subunit alcohol dehydrogenase family)
MSDTLKPETVKPEIDFARLGPPRGSRLLVVGGCGGIGQRLVAAALATELKVIVFDLPAAIQQNEPKGVVATMPIDATDPGSVDAAFAALDKHWNGLDCLVNLAGFTNARVPLDQLSPEEFDNIHAGSLRSTFLVAKAALPRLRKAGGGTVVHTASGLATRVMPGFAPYASAKAGVIALTKAVAVENGPTIRANTIAPGATDTVFLRGGTARAATHGGERHVDPTTMAKVAPLARIGVADDIVGPILFLLGPASRFMTGQVLYINGGSVMP